MSNCSSVITNRNVARSVITNPVKRPHVILNGVSISGKGTQGLKQL